MSTGYGTDSCRRRPGICLPDMGIRRWKSIVEKGLRENLDLLYYEHEYKNKPF